MPDSGTDTYILTKRSHLDLGAGLNAAPAIETDPR
jgi:hypothetical protein